MLYMDKYNLGNKVFKSNIWCLLLPGTINEGKKRKNELRSFKVPIVSYVNFSSRPPLTKLPDLNIYIIYQRYIRFWLLSLFYKLRHGIGIRSRWILDVSVATF